jgi:predicted TIM-barrel fold metal-dependent hydrolase
LDDFDAFAKEFEASNPEMHGVDFDMFSEAYVLHMMETLSRPLMHYDPHERLHDMDADGIAGEVVYHGALNGAPIPFVQAFGVGATVPRDTSSRAAELATEGVRIYNRWLSDYCSVAPERRRGLAQLPFWNVDEAVAELRAVVETGIRGINLPAPRPGLPGHHNLVWEPLWSECEELGVTLNSHAGSAIVDTEQLIGENSGPLLAHEILYWSRRVLWFMILGGVFDRHPNLVMVLTEQPGGWVMPALQELDAAVDIPAFQRIALNKAQPSAYFRSNCFIGASFMSNTDARTAEAQGFADRVMWGADYPHPEGTYPNSVLSLRLALEGVQNPDNIHKMLGETAAQVYGFDIQALAPIADKIGPSLAELRRPLPENEIPTDSPSMGFRRGQW